MNPQVGHKLWSSCAGDDYGTVVAVGHDENNTPTIDIELKSASDAFWVEGETEEWPAPSLTQIELPPNVKVTLRHVHYKIVDEERIVCNTPGNGCYRCTKLFWLQ